MDMLKDGTADETFRVWFNILNRFGNLEKITAIMTDRAASQGRLSNIAKNLEKYFSVNI